MADVIVRRKICRLCRCEVLDLALTLLPSALADEFLLTSQHNLEQAKYPLDLYLCRKCGFSQLLDVVTGNTIYLNYTHETISATGLGTHFIKYSRDVAAALSFPPSTLMIDIGSHDNDGSLLRGFKDAGYRVLGLGIDPAREMSRNATEAGIETRPEFFTSELGRKIAGAHGRPKVITANNIYANIDDLEGITVAIRELMADDGVFVFESFYALDWIKNKVFDFMYHEHLSYFSVKPLKVFFDRLGMDLFDVWPVATKGGSMRYFVQKKSGKRTSQPSVNLAIENEDNFGLFTLKTFTTFAAQIEKLKNEALTFMNPLVASGKKIAGFGASATTTTLMHHFELEKNISFIVDDFKVKQNTLSPGHKIPVFSPDVIYQENPDYIFIFAWRYVHPIIAKHKRYLEQGGKFIVPLPEFKVIDKSNFGET